MAQFSVGDVVRVTMPQGKNNRGVMGVHLMYSTSQEARCDGTVGTITAIRPDGTHGIPLYLVDFTTHQNRTGAPYTSYWFRNEWLQHAPDATPAASPA